MPAIASAPGLNVRLNVRPLPFTYRQDALILPQSSFAARVRRSGLAGPERVSEAGLSLNEIAQAMGISALVGCLILACAPRSWRITNCAKQQWGGCHAAKKHLGTTGS
jgi:hypothetical protein